MSRMTTEPDFPPGAARLIDTYDKASLKFTQSDVLTAAINFAASVMGRIARSEGWSEETTIAFVTDNCNLILTSVVENIDRKSKPTDVPLTSN